MQWFRPPAPVGLQGSERNEMVPLSKMVWDSGPKTASQVVFTVMLTRPSEQSVSPSQR